MGTHKNNTLGFFLMLGVGSGKLTTMLFLSVCVYLSTSCVSVSVFLSKQHVRSCVCVCVRACVHVCVRACQ